MLLTMTLLADGYESDQLPPNAPYTWITDEAAVKAEGAWWRDFRKASIQFTTDNSETYKDLPDWKTMEGGWQRSVTPID